LRNGLNGWRTFLRNPRDLHQMTWKAAGDVPPQRTGCAHGLRTARRAARLSRSRCAASPIG
jgi:hypothetical protein